MRFLAQCNFGLLALTSKTWVTMDEMMRLITPREQK